jgi:hypothetical protein
MKYPIINGGIYRIVSSGLKNVFPLIYCKIKKEDNNEKIKTNPQKLAFFDF